MRIRTIKPEFFLHEGLYELEKETNLPLRVAFAGLWCAADREGRFKWESRRLGIQILPYDGIDFSRVLHALTTRGFVRKYEVEGVSFGCIPTFGIHQVINNRESASFIPEPPQNIEPDAWATRASRDDDGNAELKSGREGKGREQGREGKGKESNKWVPTDEQKQVASWFGRRETTEWPDDERKAWKKLSAEIIAEGLQVLDAPYRAKVPYLKTKIITLLNNWHGEIDRWRNFKPTQKSNVTSFLPGDVDDEGNPAWLNQ